MYEFAGRYDIEPRKILAMTLKEFSAFAKGIKVREASRLAPFRVLAYLQYCANLPPKRKPMSITKFWPLETDPKPLVIDREIELNKIAELNRKWRLHGK